MTTIDWAEVIGTLAADQAATLELELGAIRAEVGQLRETIDEYGNVLPTLSGPAGERGPPGERGPAGPAWTHRRHYDAAERYRAGDVVAQDGGSSVALVDDPGPCPGDGWAALTLRGKPGQRGERGPPGERPVRLALEAGALVLSWADGFSLRCDLLPIEGLELEVAA